MLNQILESIGAKPVNWLSPSLACIMVCIPTLWRYIGFYFVILLTGLSDIPDDIYEAASIDGCSRFKQVFYITLPMMKPVFFTSVTLAVTGASVSYTHLDVYKRQRDYLVPARNHPGKFYALPQAPQQFKQILMASGFDRYFQIAPCFRDEDARADRSPGEFYQLDMEMAFASQEDVFSVVEEVLPPVFEKYGVYKTASKAPFVRIPYLEYMDKYGTDKPDQMCIRDRLYTVYYKTMVAFI